MSKWNDAWSVVDLHGAVGVNSKINHRTERSRGVQIHLLGLDVHVTDLGGRSYLEKTVVEQHCRHVVVVVLPGLVVVGAIAKQVRRSTRSEVDIPRVILISRIAGVACIGSILPEQSLRSDDIGHNGVLGAGMLNDLLGREQSLDHRCHLDDCILLLEQGTGKNRTRVLEHVCMPANHLRDCGLFGLRKHFKLNISTPSREEGDTAGEFIVENFSDLHGALHHSLEGTVDIYRYVTQETHG